MLDFFELVILKIISYPKHYRLCCIAGKSRHPGKWLPSLNGQKRHKEAKNDEKRPKSKEKLA